MASCKHIVNYYKTNKDRDNPFTFVDRVLTIIMYSAYYALKNRVARRLVKSPISVVSEFDID